MTPTDELEKLFPKKVVINAMTPTEELRKSLDELCVKWWKANPCKTKWYSPVLGSVVAVMERNGELWLVADYESVSPAQAIAATVGPKVTGDTSDGYHTFNELYHHRAMLFSVIVHDHPEIAWKSKKHHDGSMYDGMFIVGLDTPWGQATYHYDIVPYWNKFDCRELDSAPEWDGHTPDEAIARIGALSSLDAVTVGTENCLQDSIDEILRILDAEVVDNNIRYDAYSKLHDMVSEISTVGAGTCEDVSNDLNDFQCSECGVRAYINSGDTYTAILADGETVLKMFNYCPNCGKRIEVSE